MKRSKSSLKPTSVVEVLKTKVIEDAVDYTNLDCFHRAIWPILLAAQCCGLMPVSGITNLNPRHVRFTIGSISLFMTIVFLVCGTGLTFSFIRSLVRSGISAKNMVGIVFFSCGLSACILFLILARKWPQLIKYWSKIESTFLKFPYEVPSKSLSTRIRWISCLILFLSTLEHLSFFMSVTYSYVMRTKICNATNANFRDFMIQGYPHIFNALPYNIPLAIFSLILNAMFTLIWNYMDLFIIIISLGIAIRFEQLNVRIFSLAAKKRPEIIWTEIREHYVKICDLLEVVDEHVSPIILLSCLNNLYFICYQLLNIFNKLRWHVNYIYFWYSMLYLIGRTGFVFLMAATVNDESKKSLKELRKIPTSDWCVEVERLTYEMSSQCIALSGMKFYYLTRKLLFGMAGTIITYELVLLQFDESSRKKGLPPLCE